jgi:hypothetical protein
MKRVMFNGCLNISFFFLNWDGLGSTVLVLDDILVDFLPFSFSL